MQITRPLTTPHVLPVAICPTPIAVATSPPRRPAPDFRPDGPVAMQRLMRLLEEPAAVPPAPIPVRPAVTVARGPRSLAELKRRRKEHR